MKTYSRVLGGFLPTLCLASSFSLLTTDSAIAAGRTDAFDAHHGAQCVKNEGVYSLGVLWYHHDEIWRKDGVFHIRLKDVKSGAAKKGSEPVEAKQEDTVLAGQTACWRGRGPAHAVLRVNGAEGLKVGTIVAVDVIVDATIAGAGATTCVLLGLESGGTACLGAAVGTAASIVVANAAIDTTLAFSIPNPEQLADFKDYPEFSGVFAVASPGAFGILHDDNLNLQTWSKPGTLVTTIGDAFHPDTKELSKSEELPVADWNEFKAHKKSDCGADHRIEYHVRCENINDPNDPRDYCAKYKVGHFFAAEYFDEAPYSPKRREIKEVVAEEDDNLFDTWDKIYVDCTPKYNWRFADKSGNLKAHWKPWCLKNTSDNKYYRAYHARCEDEFGNEAPGMCSSSLDVTLPKKYGRPFGYDKKNDLWLELGVTGEAC